MRPNAPSALCSQIRTTERWKNEPLKPPPSSSNLPLRNFPGSFIADANLHHKCPAGKNKTAKTPRKDTKH